jgi:creatinine amidohydrolase
LNRLDQIGWPSVRDYLVHDDRVILVFGSTENNGPHLPLGSDSLAAESVAQAAAQRTGVLIAPTIPWGNSSVNMAFAGTITLDPRLLIELLVGVCSSLAFHGFRRFAIVTGHYGNVWPVASAAETLRDRGLLVAQVDLWRTIEKYCRDLPLTTRFPFGHGGEMMTSVVMAAGGGVVSERMVVELPEDSFGLKYYRSYPEVMGFSGWDDVSRSGAVGDPTAASAEAGREALERVTNVLVDLLADLSVAPLPPVRRFD